MNEFKDYIIPVRKWWWLIVASTIIAMVASYLIAGRQPDFYRAQTTLMIGRAIENPNPSGSEFWLTQQLAQTYAEIASREPIRAGTMETLGLSWLPEYSVGAIPETQLIEIAVTDTSPERAQAVANELARQLILQSPTSPEDEEQVRQSFIKQQLDGLETRINETEAEINELQDELGRVVSARQIADTQGQISALQTKLTTLQSNYANLLANTRRGAINTLNIIESASLPSVPIGPNTSFTVLVAAAIGFVLATAAAFLLEYLDDSIVTPEDITKASGLPTLAGIARINEDDQAGKLITLSQPRAPTSEAYRILRTGIQFSAVDNPDRAVIMVTSANPSEGKSLTVGNLAIVTAQAGNNVLIIDADLRRPVQHKLFNLPQKGGLTTLLLEFSLNATEDQLLASAKRVVQPTAVEGLHILTSGTIPPNPSELLGSTKMDITIKALSKQYDYIFLDCPPILAVTDATVLSRRSSGVLLVVDSGSTRQAQLKQAKSQLAGGNAHILGVVLNRLTPGSDGYYAYYYYRHSYYAEELEEPSKGQPNQNGKKAGSWRRRRQEEVTSEA